MNPADIDWGSDVSSGMEQLDSKVTGRNEILRTKLNVPRLRLRLFERPHLIELMDEGPARKMVLVTAPAGFGKTTMVSAWLRRAGYPAAWLSLDEEDGDLIRFFNYLTAALQEIDSSIGRTVLTAMQKADPPPAEALVTSLINDIHAIADHFILVLDDYHVLDNPAVHNAVTFLLDHQPDQMHLIIITRHDPPLPISGLLFRGELTRIDAGDLRFSVDESNTFLNDLMDLGLSDEDVARLDARTEGWAVGLQLAAISLKSHQDKSKAVASFSGSHRYFVDYLYQEVMSRQDPETRKFLLRTSILERFSAGLCDAVLEIEDGRRVLDGLEQANLFIMALDDERQWYRYHHLFNDFLRRSLREGDPGNIRTLHLRAMGWFEGEGLVDEAIQHALAAEAYDEAARLMEPVAYTLLIHEEHHTLISWAAKLPDGALRKRPILIICLMFSLLVDFRIQEIERLLPLLEEGPSAADASIEACASVIRAFIAIFEEEYERADELTTTAWENLADFKAWRFLPVDGLIAHAQAGYHHLRGYLSEADRHYQQAIQRNLDKECYSAVLAGIGHLGYLKLSTGELHRMMDHYRGGLHLIQEWTGSDKYKGHVLLCHIFYVRLARILYEWNELEEVEGYISRAMDLYQLGGTAHERILGYAVSARLKQARGDVDGALALLSRMDQLRVSLHAAPRLIRTLVDYEIIGVKLIVAQQWAHADRLVKDAARWVKARRLSADDHFDYIRSFEYTILARLLLVQGRPAEARALLARLVERAEQSGGFGDAVKCLCLRAAAFARADEDEPARNSLLRALELAEPEGFVRTFVDSGPAVKQVLKDCARQGRTTPYIQHLLEAFPGEESPVPAGIPAYEPLSEREVSILNLMDTELSNQEIADTLYLSINTVKWYARQIYEKLGVPNRRKAVFLARKLGLL